MTDDPTGRSGTPRSADRPDGDGPDRDGPITGGRGGIYLLAVALSVGAAVAGAAAVGAFVLGVDGDPHPFPAQQIGFDYDAGTDTMTVTHEGGDPVNEHVSSRLVVVVSEDGRTVREVVWYDRRWDDPDPVTAGDRIRVRGVDPGQTVRVVHELHEQYDADPAVVAERAVERDD